MNGNSDNWFGLLLTLLFLVVGAVMFVGGLAYRGRLKANAQGCLRTYGTIVASTKGFGGGFDTSPVYYPMIEFVVGANRFSFKSNQGWGQKIEEGTKVAVMYNPANPAIAFVEYNYYLGSNILLGIGGSFIIFALVLICLKLFS